MNRLAGLKKKNFFSDGLAIFKILPFLLASLLFSSCSELEKPQTEPYYAETSPPAKQEFRWSNGKMPKTFDPAMASAPPETDVIRAIFDGLTDTDPKTLEATPAIAEKWTSSDDLKTWTFTLRKDAKWSNNKPVTASDFVTSWKRAGTMAVPVPRRDLLQNIVGIDVKPETAAPPAEEPGIFPDPLRPAVPQGPNANSNTTPITRSTQPLLPGTEQGATPTGTTAAESEKKADAEPKIGVEAVDDHTLKVTLKNPDKQFPRLVANPVFRPVFGDGSAFHGEKLKADIVTNGAFRITSVGTDGITLDRSENYWNSAAVKLERVKFVPKDSAEQALAAYRAGELEAVTNADFEPLALKLLEPYEDFRRTTHSALNLYEFNIERPPFNDLRVREALAISIERERLTEGEMEGASRPALSLLPFEEPSQPKLVQDVEKAKKLLAEAGFPAGEGFPAIKLMINRNDAQQRIARSVLKMWKQNLNVDGALDVRETDQIDSARKTGDFDILRRGVVLPTSDETANMLAIFLPESKDAETEIALPGSEVLGIPQNPVSASPEDTPAAGRDDKQPTADTGGEDTLILTDEEGMQKLYVIPLYFPTSYSLVKSYVQGFDINALDAPSLKDVRIDTNWQPKKPRSES